jgi:hypothetical protein
MADLKISQLTGATTPLAGTEVLPIVQSGSTKKVATDDLTVKNVRSNATTGILQVAGPGAGTTRVMTTPDANFTAARTDAAQSFTGNQTFQTITNSTGVFNNVGTAQTIAIATGQAGFIVVTGVQGGVGASSWTVPFVNRLGTTAVSASPTKAVVTADPISTVTASGANIVITPLAANTYISYAIYYTPCAV